MIVWLKSGSPAMTVKEKNNGLVANESWICSWFDGKKPNQRSFNEFELTDVEPTQPKSSKS